MWNIRDSPGYFSLPGISLAGSRVPMVFHVEHQAEGGKPYLFD